MTGRPRAVQAYVEWLRVRGCLRWAAIVLVLGVALVLFGRFTYLDIRPGSPGFSGIYIDDKQLPEIERSSKQTQTTLPNGIHRTVLDNPSLGVRMTIDDRGYWGKHVELFERKAPAGVHANVIDIGDIHGQRFMLPGGSSIVKIDEGAAIPEDFNYYAVFAAFVALIVATVLGAPFGRENDGHLEIALTKPISRTRLALETIGADLAGIVAAWVLTVVALIVAHTIFEAPNFVYGPTDTVAIVVGLLGAFGWYALLCAATASMKRNYGSVLGVAWPIAIGVLAITHADIGNSPLAQLVRGAASALSWIDPLTYLQFGPLFHSGSSATAATNAVGGLFNDIPILAILALVYGALAIVQWQRVEA
jgi:ABC-type transport system involved in multi-copper enzyme maturation permease subunit